MILVSPLHVSSRQVKLHAYEYFVRLTRHCKSDPLTHCKWSAQEDFTFEQGLAEFPEGEEGLRLPTSDASLYTNSDAEHLARFPLIWGAGDENRWERIAAMLPGKTAEDVQER